jgi:hypothetical protein
VKENGTEKLLCDEEGLRIEWYNGGLAFYNMDGAELMKISDVSHITLPDLKKLNSLRTIHFKGCDNMFCTELGDSVVLPLVQNLEIEELQIAGELFIRVMRCFPAISQLTITECSNLELFPTEDGGLWDLRMLQSFRGHNCGKLFSRWHMGEVGGGSHVVKPFPTSITKLDISFEPSMQSLVEKWATVYAFSTGSRMNRY